MNITHFITESQDLDTRLQNDTVAEISNILINAFLNVISNTMQTRMMPTVPAVNVTARGEALKNLLSRSKISPDNIMVCDLRFESEQVAMTGTFCLILSNDSLKKLAAKINASPLWQTSRWRIF